MRKCAVWAAAAALSFGLLSGCTGANPTPPSSPAPSVSASSDELPVGKIQQPPALEEGWKGILADVTVTSCPTEAGKVTAVGTVVNSAKKARDLSIVIAWNAPGSTRSLMQLAVTKRAVPAGKKVDWKTSGNLPADSGPCVVLARSGKLTKG